MGSLDTPLSQEIPQSYLTWRSVAEDFGLDIFPQKRIQLQENTSQYFDNLSIPTRTITGVKRLEGENFMVLSVGEEKYFFDIYTASFHGNTLSEAERYREMHPSEEVKNILSGVPLLQYIMQQNYNDGVFGGYLNNDDRAPEESGNTFSGMTLRELQMTLRGNIEMFERNGGLLLLDTKQREQIIAQYKIYFDIVMGIGDQNEGGSDFFYKTEGEMQLYLGSIISSFGSISECIEYARGIHSNMDANLAQTRENKQLYPLICQTLGQIIFERIQKEYGLIQEEDKKSALLRETMNFIHLITSRDDTDISSSLQNPGLAEDICVFILSREGGVLDTLENCTRYRLDFADPSVGERSPQEIVSEVESKLGNSGIENPQLFLKTQMNIDLQLLVGTENRKYEDLSLDHKRQISLLARLIQKIDSGHMNPTTLNGMEEEEVTQYISDLGNEITQEAFAAVQEAYDKNFESDFHGGHPVYLAPDFIQVTKDIGVPDVDMEVFETFYDIRGYGSFNPSDETQILTSTLGRSALIIISTIAIVMIATAVTGGLILPAITPSLIASGGGLTLTGSLASIGIGASAGTIANRVIDPQSYNSSGEMLSDLGSDFIINSFHAMYMERLTMQLWANYGTLGRSVLVGGDFGTGIGIEVLRDTAVQAIFHGNPLLGERHTMSLEEAFWGLNYDTLDNTPSDIQARFEEAMHIYYLWNGYHPDFPQEPEFLELDWHEGVLISLAIELWIKRQENRV